MSSADGTLRLLNTPGHGATTRQAVLDIGSNSIRLVVYDGPKRAPAPICNEKALCGLGRDMGADGSLNPAAVEHALATLRRFRKLVEAHGDPPTHVVATAAVREAKDGRKFVREIEALGFAVGVIEGGEEARLAALGVVSYEPDATGIVGDMGGGSLELIAVEKGFVREATSLSIGPLRLMQKTGDSIADAERFVGKALDGATWVAPGRFETLYSVGGAWRAIARIHMRLKSYPLSVLHHYVMTRTDALDVCRLVSRQSRRSLEEIPGIPRRRIDTLPLAAMVFASVLERTKAVRVVTSAGGVREGLLFNALTAEERSLDPLIAGARFMAERHAPDVRFGEAVAGFTEGLFPDETPAERRVRIATCLLCDICAYFHPDARAVHAYDSAVRASFFGVTHDERLKIAWALFVRHDGERADMPDAQAMGLLSWESQQRATRLGLAMRFATALSPKAPLGLTGAGLSFDASRLVFRAPKAARDLMGELPRRRLEQLAAAYDKAPMESYY